MKAWPIVAILVIQAILFLGHWFVYSTWIAFWPGLTLGQVAVLRIAMLVLAFSFVAASLLSYRFASFPVRAFYRLASIWLGFLNLFFWASLFIWLTWFLLGLTHFTTNPAVSRPLVAGIFYAIASLAGLYSLINARVVRLRKLVLRIPNLPPSWRGRRAVLFSDLHLGPINGASFSRRIVAKANRLEPDIVFVPGDLFDGTHTDLDRVLKPFSKLTPPLGIFFSTGNHEEFSDASPYIEAIARAGIRVLANESVVVDGLRVAGVLYHDSAHIIRMKAVLDSFHLGTAEPCILLNHAPTRLPIVEQAGVSLQLSGHTHGGQMVPFTWLTRRVFGRFTSGLHRFAALQVYTSTGAGTWGPPMRIGSASEMVVFTFE